MVDDGDAMWTVAHNVKESSGNHWISRFLEDGSELIYTLPSCGIATGLAPDFSGRMWNVCNRSNKIVAIDIEAGHHEAFDTGESPYAYADFTGWVRATITNPEGSYVRLHDSVISCTDDREAYWSQLYFDVETPAGTSVEFTGRTAETMDALGFASDISLVNVPSDGSPVRISDALEAAGVANHQRYMEITVHLRRSGTAATPVFTSMTLVHYCECTCDTDDTCSGGCACDEDC
jgi:hypothetical protein